MNGETRILQPSVSVNLAVNEMQPVVEPKAAALPKDKTPVQPIVAEANGVEKRFARLKRNSRKRSASIL